MPQFYFHIRDRDRLISDEEGMVLRDLDGARREALESCRDLLRNRSQDQTLDGLKVEIAGADGTVIETVSVRDSAH